MVFMRSSTLPDGQFGSVTDMVTVDAKRFSVAVTGEVKSVTFLDDDDIPTGFFLLDQIRGVVKEARDG